MSSASATSSDTVTTYYAGQQCGYSPTYLVFAPSDLDCADGAMQCAATSVATSFNINCSSDPLAYTQDKFGGKTFVLIEEYTDEACSEYRSSAAYLAEDICQVISETSSIIGQTNDDGSASVAIYNESVTCYGTVALNLTLSRASLASQSCQGGGTYGYMRAYTNAEGVNTQASTSGTIAPLTDGSTSPTASSTTYETGITTSITILIVGIGLLAMVAAVVGLVAWSRRRSQQEKFLSELILLSGDGANPLWSDEAIIASRIPREKVVVDRLISRGAYGEVHHGVFDGRAVAVKMLPKETRRNMQHVNAFLAEAKLLSTMEHPHIVAFVGVAWNSFSDLCVVSEFMDGGDLRELLSRYERENHPTGFDADKVTIAVHVAHALVYLHSLQPAVLHRDLKSRNVLLSKSLEAKLTDFGVSRAMMGDATMTAGVGTSLWMAPEVLLGERYDAKADVFSFGVVLAELDAHALPYAHARQTQSRVAKGGGVGGGRAGNPLSDTAILQMVSTGELRVEFSSAATRSIVDLGAACVSMDPADRPTAAEALYRLATIAKTELDIEIPLWR